MQALTKNHQSREKIESMTSRAFGADSYAEHEELTEDAL